MRLLVAELGLLCLVGSASGQPACVVERFGMDHCAWNDHQSCKQRDLAYYGSLAVGKTTILDGTACQRWDSDSPHENDRDDDYFWRFPDGVIGPTSQEAGNTCANPDGEPGPWCFSMDPGNRWAFCFTDCLTNCPVMTVSNGNLPASSHVQGQATGKISTVVCDAGFGPDPATAQTYRCNAGQWLQDGTNDTSVTARCTQCPAMTSAADSAAPASFAFGTSPTGVPGAAATITCDAGYERSDHAGRTFRATCGTDGLWEAAFAADACVESPCDEQVAPGTVGQVTISYSAAAVANCRPNRYPGGSTLNVSCAATAYKWETAAPSATCSHGVWDATVSTTCELCSWVQASSQPVHITSRISSAQMTPMPYVETLEGCRDACLGPWAAGGTLRDGADCQAFTFDPHAAADSESCLNQPRYNRCFLHGLINKPLVKAAGGTGFVYVQKCSRETLAHVTGCGVDTKTAADGNTAKAKPASFYSFLATGGKTLAACAQDCDMNAGALAGQTCDYIAFKPDKTGSEFGDCALLTAADYVASGGVAMADEAEPTKQFHFYAKACAPMAL